MNGQVLTQVLLAIASWIGIPWAWLSMRVPRRRSITAILMGIVTNLGPLITPWIAMPLLAQPHLVGSLKTATFAAGILLLAVAALMEIWATPFIFPAASKGGDVGDPDFLVVKGPYRWIRHSQYLGGVLGLMGWALLRGGLYSILLSPIVFLLFRVEAYWEEKHVLEPKFGDEFRRFKEQVPTAIFGRVGMIILIVVYLAFVSLVISGKGATF
jgi:protein-S-isoprenylcysteine O-methyltransferase Ste14